MERVARLARYLGRASMAPRTAGEADLPNHLRRLEKVRAAEEHARQAETRHAEIGGQAAHVMQVAEEAVRQVAEAQRREAFASAVRSRKEEELRAAEEAERGAEARRIEAIERANRLAHLASEAAHREEQARAAAETAWEEVVRKQSEIQRAEEPFRTEEAPRRAISSVASADDGGPVARDRDSGLCWNCGAALTGRQRKWCSVACRKRAARRLQV
jgi:membrane protein involved in colicin uptake